MVTRTRRSATSTALDHASPPKRRVTNQDHVDPPRRSTRLAATTNESERARRDTLGLPPPRAPRVVRPAHHAPRVSSRSPSPEARHSMQQREDGDSRKDLVLSPRHPSLQPPGLSRGSHAPILQQHHGGQDVPLRPADEQWRERLTQRLPKLASIPTDYKQLRDFLSTIETELQATGRSAQLFIITMGQMPITLQREMRIFMRDRFPYGPHDYDALVAVLISRVLKGRPEVYMRQVFADLSANTSSPTDLYLHLSDSYDTYLELCSRLHYSPRIHYSELIDEYMRALPAEVNERIRDRVLDLDPQASLYAVAELASRVEASRHMFPPPM